MTHGAARFVVAHHGWCASPWKRRTVPKTQCAAHRSRSPPTCTRRTHTAPPPSAAHLYSEYSHRPTSVRCPPVLGVLTPAHLRPPPTCRPPRNKSLLCDGKDAGWRRVIALPTPRRHASTPQSRRRCGRVPAQMWASPGEDVGESGRRCGPVGLRGPAGTVPIGLRACDRTAACLAAVRV
jgi:hypothetical protein